MFIASVYYGASYYIDIFSCRYQQKFYQLSVESEGGSPIDDSSPYEDEPDNNNNDLSELIHSSGEGTFLGGKICKEKYS